MPRKKKDILKVNPNELDSLAARIKREQSTPEAALKRAEKDKTLYKAGDTLNKIITAPGLSNVGKNKLSPRYANSGLQTVRIAPQINSPFFEPTNFNLPLDRISRNAWCRFYYKTDPVVASALELHTDYPLTDYVNDCPDSFIRDFYDQMAFEELDIMSLLHDIGLEYWKIGDVFPIGQFDKDRGVWDHFLLLNPDYIEVQRGVLSQKPTISLIPDDKLKSIVNSGGKGEFNEQFKQLAPEIIDAVRTGQNIILPGSNVSQISHKASRYEVYGTPLLNRCFKTLLYKDKIRTAQQAIVERHITPTRIFKLGEPGSEPVTQEEIENFRNLLAQAELDPNHVIVYHNQVDFLATNNTQTIFQLTPEYEFYRYELSAGLMVNETFITGEGPNFATASVNLEVLEKRYRSYRSMLSRWIEHHVYAPVAEFNEFFEAIPSELNHGYRIKKRPRRLVYPRVSWRGRELIEYKEDAARIFMELNQNEKISDRTMLDKFGVNYDTEMSRIAKEKIERDKLNRGEGIGDDEEGTSFTTDFEAPSDMNLPTGTGDFTEESTMDTPGEPGPENMGITPPENMG